jgi:hypothetical protein
MVIGVGVLLAAIENAPPQRPLDPADASPVGAHALAELLRQRGVTVTTVAAVPRGLGATTVFVPTPRSLSGAELARLNDSAANVVVVEPGSRELEALALDARPTAQVAKQRSIPDALCRRRQLRGTSPLRGRPTTPARR